MNFNIYLLNKMISVIAILLVLPFRYVVIFFIIKVDNIRIYVCIYTG